MVMVGLLACSVKQSIKALVAREWNREWLEYKGGRQTKLFMPKLDVKKSKGMIDSGRRMFGRYVRVITGHNALNYHRHNVDNEIDEDCRFCNEEVETSFHVITECPVFAITRRETLLGKSIEEGHWTTNELAKLINIKAISGALDGLTMDHEDGRTGDDDEND